MSASIVNWPSAAAFQPRALSFGASTPKSAFAGFFTGQIQSIGHLSDRLRCTVTLPPCNAADGQAREAFFLALASTGDWVRMHHLHRTEPLGTLRGLPTVATSALAGARTLQVQTTAGATLIGGDMLSTGNQLLMTAYAGATADGAGVIAMPLVLPLALAVSAGASVAWQAPTALFQLASDLAEVGYGRGRWQAVLDLPFVQVL
jgi:hypothetical protein